MSAQTTWHCGDCGGLHQSMPTGLCPNRDRRMSYGPPSTITAREPYEKLASYLTQENAVLHERVRKLEIALAGRGSWKYPHMCRDEHQEIGHSDGEHERCPLCRANDATAAETEACAKIADEVAAKCAGDDDAFTKWQSEAAVRAAKHIAILIRGRGET